MQFKKLLETEDDVGVRNPLRYALRRRGAPDPGGQLLLRTPGRPRPIGRGDGAGGLHGLSRRHRSGLGGALLVGRRLGLGRAGRWPWQ